MNATATLQIRNSTAEFLMFTSQAGEGSIEVRVEEGTVWLTQKLIAALFDKSRSTIAEHLRHIFDEGEVNEKAVCRNSRHTANDGKAYDSTFYSLDAIISVGYRVNSPKATQFRQWATGVLRDFAIRGYVLDKARLENGSFLGEQYFDRLLEEIREIRLSERKFYQKITDIYATSLDYSKDVEATQQFFARVQNKLHYAIHGATAAELLMQRANASQAHMGLTTWEKAPDGKILKSDVVTAKNYLTPDELAALSRVVGMYLDHAEDMAKRKIPMSMADWAVRLDAFLQFNQRDVLDDFGKVSMEVAKSFVLSEFEQYRVVQDRLFQSDFDKQLFGLLEQKGAHEPKP
jgi:hypothetical protein